MFASVLGSSVAALGVSINSNLPLSMGKLFAALSPHQELSKDSPLSVINTAPRFNMVGRETEEVEEDEEVEKLDYYLIKVDGEEVEVTLDELRSAMADYLEAIGANLKVES